MSMIAVALSLAMNADQGDASMSRFRPLPDAAVPRPTPEPKTAQASPTDLPYARGKSFATLDAYLAFRRAQAAIDLPWYDEIAPDVFELRTSMKPAPPPQRFTRAELAKKFGFAR